MVFETIFRSPYARRAWVEIPNVTRPNGLARSRPTHVGRGLKFAKDGFFKPPLRSPYARRAWVEIQKWRSCRLPVQGRPTHVGRGLKYKGNFL